MAKKNIHPKWFNEAKVYCDGQHIMTVGSTKEKLNVIFGPATIPFFTVHRELLDTEEE